MYLHPKLLNLDMLHGLFAERTQRSRDMSNEKGGETQLLSMRIILQHLLDSSTLLVKVGKYLMMIAFL